MTGEGGDYEEVVELKDGEGERFLGGCLRAEYAGALGDLPDASKRHQGPGVPYTRHSKECRDDMPRGTTECYRCSRPGDLLKQQGGNSTLGFPPGGAGGWCGVGSHGLGDRGSVEAGIGQRLETVEKNPGPRRGGGVRLRRIGGQRGRGGMGGEGSVGRGGEGWGA